MDNPKVSVIMSVYNTNLDFLQESITSILNQTYENFEFIIIDDGSSNGSNQLIEKIKDSRIVYIKNDKNEGLTVNLNKAILLSKGKYLARMDADDVSVSNRFAKQVAFLEKNKNVGVLGTSAITIGNKKRIKRPYRTSNLIKARLLFNNPIIHPSVMMRAELLKENLYNKRYKTGQDYELWSRLVWKTEFANLPDFLLKYRSHENQVTTKKSQGQSKTAENARKFMLDKISSNIDLWKIELINKSCNTEVLTEKELLQLRDISAEILELNFKSNNFDRESLLRVLSENIDMSIYLNKIHSGEKLTQKIKMYPEHRYNKYYLYQKLVMFYKPLVKLLGK